MKNKEKLNNGDLNSDNKECKEKSNEYITNFRVYNYNANNSDIEVEIERGKCKCGASDHIRTSAANCPYFGLNAKQIKAILKNLNLNQHNNTISTEIDSSLNICDNVATTPTVVPKINVTSTSTSKRIRDILNESNIDIQPIQTPTPKRRNLHV